MTKWHQMTHLQRHLKAGGVDLEPSRTLFPRYPPTLVNCFLPRKFQSNDTILGVLNLDTPAQPSTSYHDAYNRGLSWLWERRPHYTSLPLLNAVS